MADAKSILLVEDEPIIAMDMEQSLADRGWNVIGPVATAQEAFKLLETEVPDVAILDYNIRGGTSTELAIALTKQSVPIIFLSGDSSASGPEILKDCPVLSKPVPMDDITALLARML